jgi:proteasome lid subunit RPN8/RPN11
MRVELGDHLLAQIRRHVESTYPEEACGVLVGRDWGDRRTVERVHALANASRELRTRAYQIAPEDFLLVDKEARETGLEVVGFYHSHPDHPPAPSRADRETAWPYYVYLIAAVWQGRMEKVQAFSLGSGEQGLVSSELRIVTKPRPNTGGMEARA